MPSRNKKKKENPNPVLGLVQKRGRPSRGDRKKLRKLEFLTSYADGQLRTRAGRKLKEILESPDTSAAVQQAYQDAKERSVPPAFVGGEKIYSGAARAFEKAFMDEYWAKLMAPGTPILCAGCSDVIQMDATGAEGRTIDHVDDWSSVKTELEDLEVCCNGHHWRVVKDSTMRAAFQDVSNLAPMHRRCNSAKSGSKTTDPIGPVYLTQCPNVTDCVLPKATT